MKWFAFFTLGILLTAGGCSKPPLLPGVNFILITIDTLRPDRLQCYGYPTGNTPNIDRLASEGILFSDMTANVPLTLPSHTSFLTGLYPSVHGVHDNGAYKLSEEKKTIAEYLGEKGYRTAAILSSFQLDKKYGIAQGFDEYRDRMPSSFTIHNSRVAGGPKADHLFRYSDQCRADYITYQVREWLEKGGSEPFLLWLHYFDPHEIYDPPPPYSSMFSSLTWPDRQYDGEIAFLDREIGRLISLLKEHGLYDRSILFFSADHGEGLGQHGELYHDTFIYNSTLHIPLLIGGGAVPDSWPSIVTEPVRSVDILPTILDLGGVEGSGFDGTSILPLLEGKQRKKDWINYSETYSPSHQGCSRLFGLSTGKWKYIEAPAPELYDLENDPGEMKNVADRHPEIATEMRGSLLRLMPEEESETIEIDDETREKLEAIGYVHRKKKSSSGRPAPNKDPKDMAHCIDGLHRSMYYYVHGEKDSSLALLLDLKIACPGRARIYDNIGNLQINLGYYDDAIEEFSELVRINPQYAKGYYWVGMANMRLKEYEEAIRWFHRAIARDSALQEAHYGLALVLVRSERYEEALKAWERTVAVDPKSVIGTTARSALVDLRETIAAH